MWHNAAWGFLISGLALILINGTHKRAAGTLGALVMAGGGLTLSQYLFDLDLGIDQLFLDNKLEGNEVSHPGRMTPYTAACFFLFGGAIVWVGSLLRTRLHFFVPALLGSIVFALGMAGFFDYFTWLETPSGFSWTSPPGLPAGPGFMGLGIGLVALAWANDQDEKIKAPLWLPYLVAVGAATATLCLWQALMDHEKTHLENRVKWRAEHIREEIQRDLTTHVQALIRMAKRWEKGGRPVRETWETDARNYVRHFTGYQAIEWVDPDHYVRWIVPLEGNEAALNMYISFEEKRLNALTSALTHQKLAVTNYIDLVQGGKGFLVCVPIFHNQVFDGFIMGVFRVQELFDDILSENLAHGYQVAIFDGEEKIYASNARDWDQKEEWDQEVVVNFYDFSWKLGVGPKKGLITFWNYFIPGLVLILGLGVSCLLALGVKLCQGIKRNAKDLELANQELTVQIKKRRRTEKALRKSKNELSLAQAISHLGNWVWEIDENKLRWSDEIYRIFGIEPQKFEATYEAFLSSVHPEDREFVKTSVDEALYKRRPCNIDYRIVRPDGSIRFVHEQGVVMFESGGKPIQMMGTVQDITERKFTEIELRAASNLMAGIKQIQELYITGADPEVLFEELLAEFLSLTQSEIGFAGEIHWTSEKKPYLKNHVFSDIAWNEETRALYGQGGVGVEWHNMDTLFEAAIMAGKPVISNDPSNDPRSGGLPEGHFPLSCFLGLPVLYGEKLIGVVGLANRPGGYDEDLVKYLQPFLATCSHIIQARKNEEKRKEAEGALKESEQGCRRIYNQMRSIVAGTSSATSGEKFLHSLVLHLASSLGVGYAFISVIAGRDKTKVRTLALCARGEVIDNVEIELAGTPSEKVLVDGELVFYGDGIQGRFPKVPFLKKWGAESYVAIPLFDGARYPMGSLAVVDQKPIKNLSNVNSILSIFAARAEAEIQRMRAEEELKRAHEQLEKRVGERTAELQTANERLQKMSREIQLILNSVSEGVYGVDLKGNATVVNPAAARMTGYQISELIGKPMHAMVHGFKADGSVCLEEDCPILHSVKTGNRTHVTDEVFWKKNGESFPVEYFSMPLCEEGKVIGSVVTFRDVTKRRRDEKEKNQSLREKEILLKEIHHRTKNNMQIISSLLWLQSKDIRQKKYAERFRECSNRILAMALLHEKMYRSPDLSQINFKDYVTSLVNDLFASYGRDKGGLQFKLMAPNLNLDLNSGIPCGLLIQELVSNSLKHAFPNGREGEICISLRLLEGNNFELKVADNGVGFPEELNFRETPSLGLQLITSLVEKQLEGVIELNTNGKTEFRILFKERNHDGDRKNQDSGGGRRKHRCSSRGEKSGVYGI